MSRIFRRVVRTKLDLLKYVLTGKYKRLQPHTISDARDKAPAFNSDSISKSCQGETPFKIPSPCRVPGLSATPHCSLTSGRTCLGEIMELTYYFFQHITQVFRLYIGYRTIFYNYR